MTHPDGGVYVGRTHGYGNPERIMIRRFYGHHMRKEGFRNPVLDEWAKGVLGKHAIRGREQQKIDSYGGVGHPKVANSIRGVAERNKRGLYYHWMSNLYFGKLHDYTGVYFPF